MVKFSIIKIYPTFTIFDIRKATIKFKIQNNNHFFYLIYYQPYCKINVIEKHKGEQNVI